MFLDDFELRTIVALGLRLVATDRVPLDDDAFDAYVHTLGERAATALRTQGVEAVPPFPGAPLAQSSRRRSVFVAELRRDHEHVGTAITSLIRGRLPNISVAPPRDPRQAP